MMGPRTAGAVRKLALVLLLIPVFAFALRSGTRWPVRLIRAAASPDGSVWAAIHREEVTYPEIWQWDSELRHGYRAYPLLCEPYQLVTTTDGELLLVLGQGQLMVLDTETQGKLWTAACLMPARVELLEDGKSLLLVERSSVRLLDLRRGQEIAQWEGNVTLQGAFWQSPTLMFQDFAGVSVVLRCAGGNIDVLQSEVAEHWKTRLRQGVPSGETRVWNIRKLAKNVTEEFPLPNGETLQLRQGRSATSQLSILNAEGDLLRQKVFGNAVSVSVGWYLALPLCLVPFTLLLVWDGTVSGNRNRLYVDATILWLLFSTPFMAWYSELIPQHARELQMVRYAPMLVAWLACLGFLFLWGTDRRLYLWASILAVCCLVFLMPAVVLAYGCRKFGLESPLRSRESTEITSRKVQFGIGDAMLGTAAIALFFAVGIGILQTMIVGFGLAVLFLFGLPALKNRLLAWGWLAVTALASGWSMMTPQSDDAACYAFPWMVLMVFALMSLYRFGEDATGMDAAPELEPKRQASELSTDYALT